MNTVAVLLLLLVGSPPSAKKPAAAAPLYSFPADGVWAEYDWEATPPDGPRSTGTLRIAAVGTKEVGGVRHRWIEMRLTTKAGEKAPTKVRKVLVSESHFQKGGSLRDAVVEVHARDGDKPVQR